MWIELTEAVGARMWRSRALRKGAGHKYIRRVPKPGGGYRYYYRATGATRAVGADLVPGAKFKLRHEGQAGHFEVVSRRGDRVTLRHDESGGTVRVSAKDLGDLLRREHADVVQAQRDRTKRNLEAARKHGTAKQVKRLEAQAAAFEATPREVQEKVEAMSSLLTNYSLFRIKLRKAGRKMHSRRDEDHEEALDLLYQAQQMRDEVRRDLVALGLYDLADKISTDSVDDAPTEHSFASLLADRMGQSVKRSTADLAVGDVLGHVADSDALWEKLDRAGLTVYRWGAPMSRDANLSGFTAPTIVVGPIPLKDGRGMQPVQEQQAPRRPTPAADSAAARDAAARAKIAQQAQERRDKAISNVGRTDLLILGRVGEDGVITRREIRQTPPKGMGRPSDGQLRRLQNMMLDEISFRDPSYPPQSRFDAPTVFSGLALSDTGIKALAKHSGRPESEIRAKRDAEIKRLREKYDQP